MPILQDSGKRTKEYAFVQWKDGYNIVSEKYSSTIWLRGDSVVARMMFDRQSDAAENENKASTESLCKEFEKQEVQIKMKKLRLEK